MAQMDSLLRAFAANKNGDLEAAILYWVVNELFCKDIFTLDCD